MEVISSEEYVDKDTQKYTLEVTLRLSKEDVDDFLVELMDEELYLKYGKEFMECMNDIFKAAVVN